MKIVLKVREPGLAETLFNVSPTVDFHKRIHGLALSEQVTVYIRRAPFIASFRALMAMWAIRKARVARQCDTCDTSIPPSGLYLHVAASKVCEPCARKYGAYRGQWVQGAKWRDDVQREQQARQADVSAHMRDQVPSYPCRPSSGSKAGAAPRSIPPRGSMPGDFCSPHRDHIEKAK